jgi:ribosomal protein S18 acetylase RimI-like enzyme
VEEDSTSLAVVELLTAPEFANFLLEGMFGEASVGAILSWRYRQGGVDSTEWSWVAEEGGAVIAAMGAYPVALSRAEQGTDEGEASERNAHFASLIPLMRDDAFHIARLGVLPQARRRGVAKALVTRAEQATREAGLALLTLVVWADNDAACALYRDLGFTQRDSAMIAPHPRLTRDGQMLLLGKDIA